MKKVENLSLGPQGSWPLAPTTRLVFLSSFDLLSLCITDKQAEDRPKSPSAAARVDPSLQEVLQQEVEKPVEGSAAFAREILGCHSSLIVSVFLCSRI